MEKVRTLRAVDSGRWDGEEHPVPNGGSGFVSCSARDFSILIFGTLAAAVKEAPNSRVILISLSNQNL